MKTIAELEKYFIINEFEEGWGMEEVVCEEQLFGYCIDVLLIPSEKIEELNMDDSYSLEIMLHNLEIDDIGEDWYVNLMKISKEVKAVY